MGEKLLTAEEYTELAQEHELFGQADLHAEQNNVYYHCLYSYFLDKKVMIASNQKYILIPRSRIHASLSRKTKFLELEKLITCF